MKKLHLGCGKRYIPGFIHMDIRKLPHVDHVGSADKLNMFENDSIDLIYACHILELFRRGQVEDVLREWLRVLKPGGTLRLSVPDFESLTKIYSKTRNLKLVIGPLVGRQDYQENTHYMVFDFAFLKEILMKIGFKNVQKYDWRETIHKDYDDFSQAYIPHMDKERGTLISLNIECIA